MSVQGVIAIPTAVSARWASFWQAVTEMDAPPGMQWGKDIVVRIGRGCSPATNRNGLIEEAKKLGAKWIWFLDDDLVFFPNSLTRLLEHFKNPEIEAVVGLSFHRQPPFKALWFHTPDPAKEAMHGTLPPPEDGLVRLYACTFGGLLVRMSAIERMEPPYVALGQFVPDQWDDDIYFCRKFTQAGGKLWGDSSVKFGHTTDIEIWPYYNKDNPDVMPGWSVVFGRALVPFVMQPWGQDESQSDMVPVGAK